MRDSCSRPSWCSFSPSAGQVQGLCVQSIRQGAPVPSSSSRAEKVLRSRTPDPSASTWRGPACRGTFSTLRHWPEYVGRTWGAPQHWSTVGRTALGRLHVSRGRLSLYSNILSGLRKLASSKFCHWTGLTEIARKDNVALIITNNAERTKKERVSEKNFHKLNNCCVPVNDLNDGDCFKSLYWRQNLPTFTECVITALSIVQAGTVQSL